MLCTKCSIVMIVGTLGSVKTICACVTNGTLDTIAKSRSVHETAVTPKVWGNVTNFTDAACANLVGLVLLVILGEYRSRGTPAFYHLLDHSV